MPSIKTKKDYRTELEKKGVPRYFKLKDEAEIRTLDFNFAENPNEYTIILVPGFITVFQSWQKAMEHLTPEFRVYYLETREKITSRIPRKLERKITLEQMAYDIKEVVHQLNLENKKYLFLSSSMGGNVLTKTLSKEWVNPTGNVMVGPSIEFHIKWIIVFLSAVIPNFIIQTFLKPLVKWYFARNYVDKKKEPEQLDKYMRALDECNMRKAMPLLRKAYRYQSWDEPPKVKTTSLLIGASSDKMHATDDTLRVHELMPNSTYVDLGSNKATHDEPLVIEIKKFIQQLEKEKHNINN